MTKHITFNLRQTKSTLDINIVCNDNLITAVPKIKFLDIYIYIYTHNTINWSFHIEYIIPKLISACYIKKSIKPFMSLNTLKTVHYYYFNAIISYALPFWGNSPHAMKIFRMSKKNS